MFRICGYEKTERILPRLLAEGVIQGLRPITGKDVLKLDQNGKRVSAALSGVLKEAVDQNRRVKNVIKTSKTLLDEIQTSEQILLNPDKRDAMQVIRRKMNERSHLLHPSVTTLTQKDYSVHGIEDENPAICHTSRGTGRLVILPPSLKNMKRDNEKMGSNSKETSSTENR